jgi:hypothetical protein
MIPADCGSSERIEAKTAPGRAADQIAPPPSPSSQIFRDSK